MSEPRIAIVVPWRSGVRDRELAWDYCSKWWEQFGWPIHLVEHAGVEPFNRAWTINEGARRAWPWDLLIAIDADVFEDDPENVRRGVESALETGRLTIPHTSGHDLSRAGTRKLMAGLPDWERALAKRRAVCTSRVWIMPRDLFAEVAGFDSRHRGWGHEDVSAFHAMRTLRGCDQLPGIAYHLWHEPSFQKARMTKEWRAGKDLAARYLDADRQGWPAIQPILAERDATERWDQPEGDVPPPREDRAADARGVDVIVLTAGRKAYLEQTIASFGARVTGRVMARTIYDDSGDPEFAVWLKETYPDWEIVTNDGAPSGFTQAIRKAWAHERDRARPAPFIFHLEEDFIFDRDVDLTPMAQLLERKHRLAQVALLRGPFFGPEIEAGGIIEEDPEAYNHHDDQGVRWLTHRKFFTTNPCLYRRSLLDEGWPHQAHSETVFTRQMRRRGFLFAFWGDGEPWVSHIGAERTGLGY